MKRRTNISNVLLASTVFAAAALSGDASAQVANDPTELGGGKKAYVVMIIDSSASMEYTTEGDNIFPTTGQYYPLLTSTSAYPGLGVHFPSWSPGDAMNAGAVHSFGSCFVYHPDTGCGSYRRPGWRPEIDASWPLPQPPASWGPGSSWIDPLPDMRGSYSPVGFLCSIFNICDDGWRLQNPTQPRHVTVKEILTGNMILLPSNAASSSFHPNFWDAERFGPGCWFIPRQRDASLQPLADQTYCEGDTAFDGLPDYDQPVPHFQEVYDLQQPTGVLDTLSTTALFAVAAFDGYRERPDDPTTAATTDPWGGFGNATLNGIDDNINNSPPDDSSGIRADTDEDDPDCDEDGTADDPCYNLGIWHIVGPSTLDVPNSMLPQLAAYSQIAVNDTGYLTKGSTSEHQLHSDETDSQDNAFLGASFSPAFANYVRPTVPLGKQPIARATPIAAAIQDVYQFLAYGQDVGSGSEDPINTDTFVDCRPKHVVMLTDGQPSPERDPTTPTGVSDTLNEAFGYEPTRYKYDTAEQEIALLTNDVQNIVPPADSAPAYELNKYEPRVHVLGLNLDTADDEAIAKMAAMAIEGKSCASALVPELVPNTHTYEDLNGDPQNGTCSPGTGCLVDQGSYVNSYLGGSSYDWQHPQDETIDIDCSDFPALILDDNDPDQLGAALSSFLSALVQSSGLTTRTRLAVSNRLDDVSIPGGGQYRVYSGVRVGGGSAWWKGVINRNTLRCDSSPTDELSIDEEIAQQVQLPLPTAPLDSRRVWTALPAATIWDYAGGGLAISPISSADTDFPMQYALQDAGDGNDEFKDTYLPTESTGEDLVLGTRIPFEYSFISSGFPGGTNPLDQFNVFSSSEFDDVVNVFRGRIPERISVGRGGNVPDTDGEPQERVLGGILNSNPLVVGPPDLDLPIASYRDFRARFADRTSMLYVASMDGLLHAIHLGELEDRVMVRGAVGPNAARGADLVGSAFEQREAWAYMPWMLTRELSSYQYRQAYLMDGTPVAEDVRLCSPNPTENSNVQACQAACQGTCSRLSGADQWRTVLVQGRGLAGAGYYAMDISRPGGLQFDDGGVRAIEAPDPILLWELDREWEAAQVAYYMANGETERITDTTVTPDNNYWNNDQCNNDVSNFHAAPMMGLSVSEAEIGTAIINGRQRAIAVFGGGSLDVNATGCGASATGMAIYVVDLQTGSIIRRFTAYQDGAMVPFASGDGTNFIGSPTLFDSATGAVATRGFIGDNTGRLFKIDMLSQDPFDWSVSLFFDPDPAAYSELAGMFTAAGHTGTPDWGPAGFRPAVTVNANREVVVVYGLGETGDVVTNNQAQAVIAVVENRSSPGTGFGMWIQILEPEEKITGAPIIFNADVYFPTYALPDNVCEPGFARIWGLDLVDSNAATLADTNGIFDQNPTFSGVLPAGIQIDPDGTDTKWFGPEDPALIRGLTITLGPLCALADFGSNSPSFNADNNPQPQLIAQTSNPVATDLTNTDQVDNPLLTNAMDRLVTPIAPPASQTVPLSWSLIY